MRAYYLKFQDYWLTYLQKQSLRGLFFVILLLLVQVGNAQTKTQTIKITGSVKDSKTNQVLPGAYIKIKGTNEGTTTDFDGNFTLKISNPKAILDFSYMGYLTQSVTVGGRIRLDILLEEETQSLDEVVVIGYGTSKRKDLTGSVGKADVVSMKQAPVASIDQAFAGRIAGVVITSSDGQPGAAPQITIRGGSVSQDGSPLYVIDGFPVENMDINSINPNDIESMDVLKDASSIAIYGARGANGVIIINTKRGIVSAPRFTYSFSTAVQQDIKRVKMMSPYQFVKLQIDLDSIVSTPSNPSTRFSKIYLDPANGVTLESYKNPENSYDWQDLLLRTGITKNHSLNITGGTDDTKYSISGNVFDQKGIILNTGMNRYDGKISFDQKITKKLKLAISASYSSTRTYGTLPSTGNGGGVVEGMWKYRPVSGVGNQDLLNSVIDSTAFADFNSGTTATLGDNTISPLLQAQNEFRKSTNNTGYLNASLEYTFFKSVKLKISGGYNATNAKREQYYNSNTQQGNLFKNSSGAYVNTNGINASYGTAINQSYLTENTLSYRDKIFKNHVLDVMVGFTYQYANTNSISFNTINIPQATEYLVMSSIVSGTATAPGSGSSQWQLASLLGRVNYTIGDKYLFTATLRNDGSSKFSPGKQWGYFPSGAFAWRFSNEPFMKKVKSVLNDAKLRLSYGSVGNNKVNDFAYLSQFGSLQTSAGYPYNNTYQTGLQPYFYGNTNITWETSKEFDLGINLGFFKDRIFIDADYYRKKTSNFLLGVTLPMLAGYGVGSNTQYQNTGDILNQGFEFTFNSMNVASKKFQWNSSFNISFNKGKILSFFSGMETRQQGWGMNGSQTAWIAKVGGPIAEFYGYTWDGCYQYADFDKLANGVFSLKNGIPTYSAAIQPGDAKYKDINSDGKVDVNDQTVIGHPLPIHTGGFNNNFIYKNFSLNIFLQWSYGNDVLNANRLAFETNGGYFMNGNQFATYSNRWTPINPTNDIPRARYNSKTDVDNVTRVSSRFVEDASFLRLKTVSLSYTIPQTLLKKLKIQNIRLTASAQNILTFTHYSGLDPEVSNFRTSNPANSPFGGNITSAASGTGYSFVQPSSSYTALSPGYDYTPYPRTFTLNFGVNVTF